LTTASYQFRHRCDLRQHLEQYRIIIVNSGRSWIPVKQLQAPIGLFLVDQRMTNISGTEFLAEAMKLYPQTRKALLTAYADTKAAIDSINSIGLDYYLMKPWHPPEENLYPVLDDLLEDWQATPDTFDGLGRRTLWSAHSHNQVPGASQTPYQWLILNRR
jgi:thioredoxin reductase (NADPH)